MVTSILSRHGSNVSPWYRVERQVAPFASPPVIRIQVVQESRSSELSADALRQLKAILDPLIRDGKHHLAITLHKTGDKTLR